MGLMSYYHKFVKNYGKIVAPLTTLLKNNAFTWTLATDQTFQALKYIMFMTLVLVLPDFTKTFFLECDAFGKGIGEILMQDGWPLAFTNKKISKINLDQSIYEKEMLDILHVMDILGQFLHIKTDHQSLKYFLEQIISS
jgi:hypothetical protein